MIPSIHDSLLYAYEVDGDRKHIVLHTRPHSGGGTARVDIVFAGVEAYHFEGDCLGNIVFGIEALTTSSEVDDPQLIEKRYRRFGWPRGWNPPTETFDEFVANHRCRIYQLTSSYGMEGFVVARRMESVQVGEPTQDTR